jgi:LDH2 family malate/lactate/ureidoglycolate dehydrogenase
MTQAPAARRIDADALRAFTAQCFITACDVVPEEAAIIAKAMVEADLVGSDAHGTFRLPQYIKAMKAGEVNARPDIKITIADGKAVALLDGDHGMGHLTMTRAAETAAKLARQRGIGWVGLRNSNHAGAIGNYAANLAEQGLISICSAVSGVNQLGPTGSAEPLLGTNPIAFAIPGGATPPFVLDVATSQVAYGKILTAKAEGRMLPEGWLVNRDTGAPELDPSKVATSLMTALGDYKGLGMSMALGLIGGVLNGASFGRAVPDYGAGGGHADSTGQFIMALDVDAFRPFAAFTADIDGHFADFTGSKKMQGHDKVRLPGMERAARKAERSTNGIPMNASRIGQLDALATQLGLAKL